MERILKKIINHLNLDIKIENYFLYLKKVENVKFVVIIKI